MPGTSGSTLPFTPRMSSVDGQVGPVTRTGQSQVKQNVDSMMAPVRLLVEAEMADGRIVRLQALAPKRTEIKVHPLRGESKGGLILTGSATVEITGYNMVVKVDGIRELEQETLIPQAVEPCAGPVGCGGCDECEKDL